MITSDDFILSEFTKLIVPLYTQPPPFSEYDITNLPLYLTILGGGEVKSKMVNDHFLQNYSGHRKPVVELYSDSDGQYLFSSSKDKSVRVWNLETETEIGEISLSHPGKLSRNIFLETFYSMQATY